MPNETQRAKDKRLHFCALALNDGLAPIPANEFYLSLSWRDRASMSNPEILKMYMQHILSL